MERSYFTTKDVDEIERFIGRKISSVTYYLWHNNANQDNGFEFLYALELKFEDKGELLISSGDTEENPKLCFNEIAIAEEQLKLDQTFNGRLTINEFDASDESPWNEVTGKVILRMEADLDAENKKFYGDFINLQTEQTVLRISIHPQGDGLNIELLEEDENA